MNNCVIKQTLYEFDTQNHTQSRERCNASKDHAFGAPGWDVLQVWDCAGRVLWRGYLCSARFSWGSVVFYFDLFSILSLQNFKKKAKTCASPDRSRACGLSFLHPLRSNHALTIQLRRHPLTLHPSTLPGFLAYAGSGSYNTTNDVLNLETHFGYLGAKFAGKQSLRPSLPFLRHLVLSAPTRDPFSIACKKGAADVPE